jgi:hypothetical protein
MWKAAGEPWEIAQAAFKVRPKQKEEFPWVVDDASICDDPPPLAEVLIPGILKRGEKMVLGGASKSYKTWTMIDLAISAASGVSWWNYAPSGRPLKVLYLNLEIQRPEFIQRMNKVLAAKGLDTPKDLKIIHLRGMCEDHSTLLPRIAKFLEQQDPDENGERWMPDIIIIDPIYKILTGSESDIEVMSGLLRSVENLGHRCNAATVMACHFAKGNSLDKAVLDRVAGSGIVARDADTFIAVTQVVLEDRTDTEFFELAGKTRNFESPTVKYLRWEFPMLRPDSTITPDQLAGQGGHGRRSDRRSPLPGAPRGTMGGGVPTPSQVLGVLEALGGSAPASTQRSDCLTSQVRERLRVTQREAVTAVAQAEGQTIWYTGSKMNKGTYVPRPSGVARQSDPTPVPL